MSKRFRPLPILLFSFFMPQLMALAQPWQREPTTFMGVQGVSWNSSVAQVVAAFPGLRCTETWKDIVCPLAKPFMVEIVPTRLTFFFRKDGQLADIFMNFDRAKFKAMRRILVNRFGQPSVSKITLGTPDLIWYGRRVKLELEQGDPGSTDKGAVFTVTGGK